MWRENEGQTLVILIGVNSVMKISFRFVPMVLIVMLSFDLVGVCRGSVTNGLQNVDDGQLCACDFGRWEIRCGKDVSINAKGGLVYCGRQMILGRMVYFLVPHTNYAGIESEFVKGPLYISEEDLRLAIEIARPDIIVRRCECGCWNDGASHRGFFMSADFKISFY